MTSSTENVLTTFRSCKARHELER